MKTKKDTIDKIQKIAFYVAMIIAAAVAFLIATIGVLIILK